MIRVLLADDCESLLSLVSNYLTAFGIQTICAYTRFQCSSYLATCDVDVLVSDLVIDNGHVFPFLERIREQYPLLPIIVWTGYHQEQLPQTLLECFPVVYKPFMLEEVRTAIFKAIK